MKPREYWVDDETGTVYQRHMTRSVECVHVREVLPNEPSTDDMRIAVRLISDLALFAANHNCMQEPVPALIRVREWLEALASTNTSPGGES